MRVTKCSASIHTDSGQVLATEYALPEVAQADILLVPGAGNATTLRDHWKIHNELFDWLLRKN